MPQSQSRSNTVSAERRSAKEKSATLPPPDTRRWLPRHKAEVVAAVSDGVLDMEEACSRYALTPEEFNSWQNALHEGGHPALRTRHVQERRKAERRKLREPAVAVLGPEVEVKCFIVDISNRGARLEFRTLAPFPPVFRLCCTKTGRSVRVYVVWQRERVVGVSFDTAAPWAIEAGIDTWLLGERP